MDINALSLAYINMRSTKRDLDDKVKHLEADMERLAQCMLQELKAQGATSINTSNASVQYQLRSRYFTTEWAAFRQWAAKTAGAVDLFEGRLHQGNLEQWLKENPDLVPPGLQADTKETVRVVAK